jgi:hypothetical protein
MKPSIIGESSVIIAVLSFIIYVVEKLPNYIIFIPILFGFIFIIDYMNGGLIDKGIFRSL